MSRSDFQCLAKLLQGESDLSQVEVYKACAAVANNGLRRTEETALSPQERNLLEIRRMMKRGEFETARDILRKPKDLSPILEGDRLFLLANVMHRKGLQGKASELMRAAARSFAIGNDEHRSLRGLANSLICTADIDTCNLGELIAVEQKAARERHHDIVAIIQRTRAIELMRAGKMAKASGEAQNSITSFEKDGCPEDKAVATCLAAIGFSLQGHADDAQLMKSRVLITDGKVAPYFKVLNALASGKSVDLHAGHPLFGVDWKKCTIKAASILGQIIERLKRGPAGRDELIYAVWGETATHPSYNHRLHSALNTLKRRTQYKVEYDGTRYKLV